MKESDGFNLSTRLAVRWLTSHSNADRDDALEGLILCCLKASGTIKLGMVYDSLEGAYLKYGQMRGDALRLTRDFIRNELLNTLSTYRVKTAGSIADIAEEGYFRYIPRIVKLRMIDALRVQYKAMGLPGRRRKPRCKRRNYKNLKTVIELMGTIWSFYTEPDGRINYQRATEFHAMPRRKRKSMIVAALARRNGVSLQQARAYFRSIIIEDDE